MSLRTWLSSRRSRHTGLRPPPLILRRPSAIGHVTGLVLVIGGAGMLLSAGVDVITSGPDAAPLTMSAVAVGLPGLALWRLTRTPDRLPTAQVFAAVAIAWIGLSLAGTIPYLATGAIPSFDNALFEAISGFTTTGATILRPIRGLGPGILFWRSMTQWFGGMGVIVLAVAVLPFLGVGGLGLMQAEAPGPSSERLVPRVRETARRLWFIYLLFSGVVTLLYWLFGMSVYDAVTHMFTTVSTGGFSPHDASFAHFASDQLEWLAILFMAVAGGNFALYWRVLSGRGTRAILTSTEARAYAVLVLGTSFVVSAWNIAERGFSHDVVRGSIFSVVSISSTTGYTTDDFATWASPVTLLLLFAMALGGMTGSTAGGLKVFRLLAILGYARRQVIRQMHPRLVSVVRIGREVVDEDLAARVVGFFGLFMAIGAVSTFVVAALGSDMITAISAAASSIGNVGPGLGDIGPTGHFTSIPAAGRLTLVVTMLLGRLEIFPLLLGGIWLSRAVGRRLHMLRRGLGGMR